MDQKLYNSYVKILKNELVPALGCTEPIAIAYAAAKAHEVLGQMPEKIELCCSGNIIKNVKGVKVPNSNGLKGIDVAATLGVVGGRADRELEVLEDVTEADIEKTKELVQQGFCTCTLKEGVENLYIVAKVIAGEHSAEVTIVNRHTLISRIVKDDEVLYQIAAHEDSPEYVDKSVLNVKDILEFADTVRIEDVKDILDRQITMNSAISDEGLNHPYGAQVGRTLLNDYGNDVKIRARARAAAGSDARMSGCSLPVVSNLIAVHQKKYIGSLSAYCGAVSAGCGAGAAITYLSGGSYEDVSLTIVNTIGNVGGIVCDGAKSSCAAKIASAVDAAILAHYMGQHHRSFQPGEGIVREDVEDTIKSMGYIGRVGMKDTDTEILNIMIDRVDIDEVCK